MSTIVTDTITGKSTATTITIGSTPVVSASANSMTIRGEGSNQTSIQQGLCKAWCHFTGTGTVSIDNSFNVGSITDTATGRYTVNFSTAYGDASYTCSVMSGSDGNTLIGRPNTVDATPTTSAFAFRVVSAAGDANAANDDTNELFTSHGDLS